jgi:hypothetical protein
MSKKATIKQLEALEERIDLKLLQLGCSHTNFTIKDVVLCYGYPYTVATDTIYKKICSDCGLVTDYDSKEDCEADRKILLTKEIKQKQAELKKIST